ncbi:MAG: RNA polymerase sigma factor [Planctomycetota bacterium]|nr:RNA polymerase sigma factor [Planctomycetota bacterium]
MKPIPEMSDAELLAAIAERRDREAFEALYARHADALLSLARRITEREDLAEDAVQEGMLTIWTRAGEYRGEGAARPWMLSIVAGKSVDILRVARRHAMKGLGGPDETREGEAGAMEKIETVEAVEALRRAIDMLSPESQRLLALYYGGGMTHADIARAMKIPRSTVSFKLARVLDKLRSCLGQAGLAAMAHAASNENMAKALCSGHTASPSLRMRVVSSLSDASAGPAAAKGASAAKTLAIAGALAGAVSLAVVAAAIHSKRDMPDTGKPPGATRNPDKALDAPDPGIEGRLLKRWDFRMAPPTDSFRVLRGEWKWESRQGMAGMFSSADQPTVIEIPVEVASHRAIKISVTSRFQSWGSSGVLMGTYCGNGGIEPNVYWGNTFTVAGSRDESPPVCKLEIYAFRGRIVLFANGSAASVKMRVSGKPPSRLGLILKCQCVETMEVSALTDVPARVRDIESVKARMDGPFTVLANGDPRRLSDEEAAALSRGEMPSFGGK